MEEPEPNQPPEDRNQEFMTLYTASHDKLLGYLLALLGRWHDAQDVLQRASLLMWQKFGTFESGTDFVAWASTFCFYEAKHFQRTVSRSATHFDTDLIALLAEERVTDLKFQEHRFVSLESCLQSLGGNDRALLRASCSGHGDISLLAAKLGRAPATLYNKLSHLRRLLADCVSNRLQEELA